MLRSLARKISSKGFEGPFYSGVRGKLRFAIESTLARSDLIFIATPESFAAVAPATQPRILLFHTRSFDDVEQFRSTLDAEYYPGYLDTWRAPFGWGEELVVAMRDNRPVGFAWVQYGGLAGFPTYYGVLYSGEARILRVGVPPSCRRQGINTAMLYGVLSYLFSLGVSRAFIECHKLNLPSVRTFIRVGYSPTALITVVECPGVRGFIRWSGVNSVAEALRHIGVELPPRVRNNRFDLAKPAT